LSDVVLDKAVRLVSQLCVEYGISPLRIYRHYDCTGKDCPRWWVDHTEDWHAFLNMVRRELVDKYDK
jgi:N-acetylmuramoyl-L-alanine amidase